MLDPVGGDVFTRSIGTLSPLGTIVAIGFRRRLVGPTRPALMVGRNLALQGFFLGG